MCQPGESTPVEGSAISGSDERGGATRSAAGTLRAAGAVWSNGIAPITTGASWPAVGGLGQRERHPLVHRLGAVRHLARGAVGQQGAPGVARKRAPGV